MPETVITRPEWVTQAEIDKVAAVAVDDVKRSAGGPFDLNPYSTCGGRAEWKLGYDLRPHGHHGVHVAGPLSWSAIWERGVQARLLIDKEKYDARPVL